MNSQKVINKDYGVNFGRIILTNVESDTSEILYLDRDLIFVNKRNLER